MGNAVFNITVRMGRLFMASLFLFMVIICIPFMGIFAVIDRHARKKSTRATTEYID